MKEGEGKDCWVFVLLIDKVSVEGGGRKGLLGLIRLALKEGEGKDCWVFVLLSFYFLSFILFFFFFACSPTL